ncbi:MAG: exo-alpha-sialidase [Arachidicoccus sp.]|nr:exo-alpha-sialidase [Arachidicoccus sp.]
MILSKKILLLFIAIVIAAKLSAQDTVHYSGSTLVNADYSDGRLHPVVGVHSIEILRANRQHPETSENFGWTYNHQPMLAYWHNKFYLEYLSDSVGESVPPGHTLLTTSEDGYHWQKPAEIFPRYKIPDGTTKAGVQGVANNLYSVMHQRMGFYTSKSGRLLVLGFYGIVLAPHDDPNDGKGIGRVVREIYSDGKMSPIYFIHYNPAWNTTNTLYPFYTKSKDKGFIDACNELMNTPLMMMQWVEETDKKDSLIPLHKDYKAFNFYHLPDGRVVGLWKYALTSISKDECKTWGAVTRAPHFVNSNAKIWGQKTSDGKYVTVYNPSEFRWPLALSVSKDGLNYTNLLLVNGEIPPMRYGGAYKSYGPQYTRGIIEGNGIVPDGNLWVTYSMNKEDIWISEIPVPITDTAYSYPDDDFNKLPDGKELLKWNYYSPQWCPVEITKMPDGEKALTLKDWDPFDYAKAERIFPETKNLSASFTIIPGQNNHGQLDIEFQNAEGTACIRLTFDSMGNLKAKSGYRDKNILKYEAGKTYTIDMTLNTDNRFYSVSVNSGDHKMNNLFFAPVHSVERIVFRTGSVRRFPNIDTPTDQDYDLPNAGEKTDTAIYYIKNLKTDAL